MALAPAARTSRGGRWPRVNKPLNIGSNIYRHVLSVNRTRRRGSCLSSNRIRPNRRLQRQAPAGGTPPLTGGANIRGGVYRTYISGVERGVRNPTVTVVAKLPRRSAWGQISCCGLSNRRRSGAPCPSGVAGPGYNSSDSAKLASRKCQGSARKILPLKTYIEPVPI